MKWKLINEDCIPNDLELLNSSYKGDVSNTKYTPTREFAKLVYDRFNNDLFYNFLVPSDSLKFKVIPMSTDVYGKALCKKTKTKTELTPTKVVLNSKYKLTIHSWMEVILHEMIHICDYLQNPKNFYTNSYDAHGEWFMNKVDKFKQYGFNVKPYGDIGHEIDTNQDMKLKTPNIFIVLGKDIDDSFETIVVHEQDMGKCIEKIHSEFPRKRKIAILKTFNTESEELDFWTPNSEFDAIFLSSNELESYGPFTRETKSVVELKESSDKIGVYSTIDEYIEIAKTIKGIEIRRIDDDNCEIGIS